MASHFSANQYENAFSSRRLQNWELPKTYKERPDSYEGFTQIIANDRGHLKEEVPRSKQSPWGTFVATWDMPRTIPGNITTYVARTDPAVNDIKTQRMVHEKYMESATSPKKNNLLASEVSDTCIPQQKTPPPTVVPAEEAAQDEEALPEKPSSPKEGPKEEKASSPDKNNVVMA